MIMYAYGQGSIHLSFAGTGMLEVSCTAQLLTLVTVWALLVPGALGSPSMSPGSREAAEPGEEVMILMYQP